MAATLINAFEVPPEADDAFIAAWSDREGFAVTTLHRALRLDVDFRFVEVAQVDSPDAGQAAVADPAFPGPEMPFGAHPGVYEVARLDGDPDVAGGVVLINAFEVTPDADERFLAAWDGAREVLSRQEGYIGTRLHRSIGPADFRFVNIARWSSPLMFARALKREEFRRTSGALTFPSHPALYQPVRG